DRQVVTDHGSSPGVRKVWGMVTGRARRDCRRCPARASGVLFADDGWGDDRAFRDTAENVVRVIGRQHEFPFVLLVPALTLATPTWGTHHWWAATTTGTAGTSRGGGATGQGTPRGTTPRPRRGTAGPPRTRRRTTSTPR